MFDSIREGYAECSAVLLSAPAAEVKLDGAGRVWTRGFVSQDYLVNHVLQDHGWFWSQLDRRAEIVKWSTNMLHDLYAVPPPSEGAVVARELKLWQRFNRQFLPYAFLTSLVDEPILEGLLAMLMQVATEEEAYRNLFEMCRSHHAAKVAKEKLVITASRDFELPSELPVWVRSEPEIERGFLPTRFFESRIAGCSAEFIERYKKQAVLAAALVSLSEEDWYVWKAFKSRVNFAIACLAEKSNHDHSRRLWDRIVSSTVEQACNIIVTMSCRSGPDALNV